MNIRFDNRRPILSSLPEHYENLVEKIYTFDYNTNSLYRGRAVIQNDVSKRIPSMGETLRRIIDHNKNIWEDHL